MKVLWIIIDEGETFEGTLEMFRDCFFSNADRGLIEDWCAEQGMKVEFSERNH